MGKLTMNNDRAFIRHEILNIITLVNFLIMASDLEKKGKEDILARLKMVALLTAEMEVFLGRKRKFSRQRVELSDIFGILDFLLKEPMKRKRARLSVAKTDMVVWGDRDVILGGVEQIILRLMDFSKNIDAIFDKKQLKLFISYDTDESLNVHEKSLIDLLKSDAEHSEIFFHAAIYLMNLSGVRTVFKKKMVEVIFSK